MFTGLVEAIGVLKKRAGRPVARAFVECAFEKLALGESINVNGVCLTVDAIHPNGFECDLSSETVGTSTLGRLALGTRVHLERATPLGGRMGGHVVLGHADGTARVAALEARGEAKILACVAPKELARFLAPKGSIAIDGVSLTLNEVASSSEGERFHVMLVPHTLSRTNLASLANGDLVNIEVDVLARYVARQLEIEGRSDAAHDRNDERLLEKLRQGGWT